MKPLGVLGIILIVLGAVVVAMKGVSYIKDRDTARIGPISVTSEEKGYITPLAGVAALGIGLVLVAAGRERRA